MRLLTSLAGAASGVVAAAHLAAAADFDLRVTGGAGYDSNALLEIRPNETSARAKGLFTTIEPEVSVTSAPAAFRGYATYDGMLRLSPSFGFLAWHTASAGASYYGRTTRASVGVGASHFYANQFADERFFGIGPELAASTALSDRLRVQTNVLAQWRFGDSFTRRLDAAALSARLLLPRLWHVGARISAMALAGETDGFGWPWWRARVGPFAGADAAAWKLEAAVQPFVGVRQLEGSAHVGQVGAVATVSRSIGRGFGVRGHVDFVREWGPLVAGRANRFEGLLALTWENEAAPPPRAVAPQPADDKGDEAPRIEGQRVIFRLRADRARSVVLLGSFDDWGEGLRMQRQENGMWSVSFDKRCGRLRYRFMVDDIAVKPPLSPRYVPDGFGGIDGEIDLCSEQGVSPPTPGSL